MRPVTFLVTALAVAPLTSSAAQEQPPLESGERVRVTAPVVVACHGTGVFVAVSEETLTVRGTYGTVTCPLGSVTTIEVQRGRKSSAAKGATVGLLLGAGLGALIGATMDCWGCHPGPVQALQVGLFVGGIGTGIGAVIGSAFTGERWEEVPLDQLRVSFAPQRDGRFGLGLSVGL